MQFYYPDGLPNCATQLMMTPSDTETLTSVTLTVALLVTPGSTMSKIKVLHYYEVIQ